MAVNVTPGALAHFVAELTLMVGSGLTTIVVVLVPPHGPAVV